MLLRWLSWLFPIRHRARHYSRWVIDLANGPAHDEIREERWSWWQWRGRIYGLRRSLAGEAGELDLAPIAKAVAATLFAVGSWLATAGADGAIRLEEWGGFLIALSGAYAVWRVPNEPT